MSKYLPSKIPELPPEQGVTDELRFMVNKITGSYRLQRLEPEMVRIVSDKDFEELHRLREEQVSHPIIAEAIKNLEEAYGGPITIDRSIPMIRALTDMSVRSKNIYIRNSAVGELREESKIGESPHNQKVLKEVVKLGTTLIEEVTHISCIPSYHAVTSDRFRNAADSIVVANAQSMFGKGWSRNLADAYMTPIREFAREKSGLTILVSGMKLGLIADGKYIATAQYNANECAVGILTEPIVNEFLGLAGQVFPRHTFRLKEPRMIDKLLRKENTVTGSQVYSLKVREKEIEPRLALCGSDDHRDRLRFYLSGNYFNAHMRRIPDEPFLP